MDEQTLTGDQSPAPRGLIASMGWAMALLARHWWRLMLFGFAVLLCMISLQWAPTVSRSFAFVSAFLLTPIFHAFAVMAGLRLLYNWEHGITPWWRVGASRLLLPAIGLTVMMQLMLWGFVGLVYAVLGIFGLSAVIPAIVQGAPVQVFGAFWIFAVAAIVLAIVSVRLIPWIPLMSLRRLGVIAALKRAWSLTFDSWWFTALLAVFYAALTLVAGMALSLVEVRLYALLPPGDELIWWIMVALAPVGIAFSIALVVPVGYVLVHSLEVRETARLERLRPVSRNLDR